MDVATSRRIIEAVRAKRAGDAASPVAVVDEQARAQLMQDALTRIGRASVFGAGFGTAAVGLQHLVRLMRERQKPRTGGPAELDLAVPAKVAADSPVGAFARFLSGVDARSVDAIPWEGAAAVSAGVGSYALARHLAGSRLKKLRDEAGQQDLASARQVFEDALREGDAKAAGDHGLGQALSRLYAVQKAAVDGGTGLYSTLRDPDTYGKLLNTYGLYAAPAALASAYAMYRATAKGRRRVVLDKAIQMRERERYAKSPSEIFVVPSDT